MSGRRAPAVACAAAAGSLALVLAGCASPSAAPPTPGAPTASAPTASAPTAPGPTVTPTQLGPQSASPTAPTASSPGTPASAWRTGPTVPGIDVSRYNPRVDWRGLAASGYRFVYVKATEGTSHRSPTYAAQWDAAGAVGWFRGAYHYARPAASSGAAQARFFTAHGGAWTPDGRTLPGSLDLEQSTSGPRCHGLSVAQLQAWVREFSSTYAQLNGRPPVVYVKAEVWRECVGNARPADGQPLWLYDHEGGPDPLPVGWTRPTLWQRGVEANLDRNVFFGTEADLARWATTG